MKIFVSSVRRGLEEERDALPGLILALGHEPMRFEDFTAQPVPSREACLAGVEDSDAYLLLLGSSYGEPVFDTGLSPTEEEWNAARRRGIPVLVFRKRAVEMESRQRQFAQRVEEYTGGRFRVSFDGPVDLQPQVVRALGELVSQPPDLVWMPLGGPVEVPWIQDLEEIQRSMSSGAILECHLVSVNPRRRVQATDLEALPNALAQLGRDHGLFDTGEALDLGVDADRAWAIAGQDRRGRRRGIQVRRDGTSSVWEELPSDGLGQIFDRDDVRGRLRAALLLASEAAPATSDRWAPGVGVAPIRFLVEARADDLGRRTTATIGSPRYDAARVEPEESFPMDSLPAGANEIAGELTARLAQVFAAARR